MERITQHQEPIKHVVDALAVGTVLGTLAAWLPPVAAIFTIVWSMIRIYETKTVQGLINRKKNDG